MTVYKLFLQLIKRNGLKITIAMLVILIFLAFVSFDLNTEDYDFSNFKAEVSVVNRDQDSQFTKEFLNFLESKTTLRYIEDDAEKMADSIFYDQADYVLLIPAGFGADYLAGAAPKLEKKTQSGNSTSAVLANQVDLLIDNYLNSFRICALDLSAEGDLQVKNNLTDQEIAAASAKTASYLDEVTETQIKNNNAKLKEYEQLNFYFAILAYVTISCFITAIAYTFISMQDINVRAREYMGNISKHKKLLANFLAVLTYGLIFWLVAAVIAIAFYGKTSLFTEIGVKMLGLSLAANFAYLGLGYMLGSVLSSKGMASAVGLIVGLGLSFGSGAFTPIEAVSDVLINISKAAPMLWQLRANELIIDSFGTMGAAGQKHNQELVWKYLGLIFLLGIIYFVLGFVFQLYKEKHQFQPKKSKKQKELNPA